MALVDCQECGKRISDKAKSCPSCGSPVSQSNDVKDSGRIEPSAKAALFSLGFATVAIALLAYFVSPDIPWWGYLLLWMVAAGFMFKGLVRDQANANLSDRG